MGQVLDEGLLDKWQSPVPEEAHDRAEVWSLGVKFRCAGGRVRVREVEPRVVCVRVCACALSE